LARFEQLSAEIFQVFQLHRRAGQDRGDLLQYPGVSRRLVREVKPHFPKEGFHLTPENGANFKDYWGD
jgi:hypothetical protein